MFQRSQRGRCGAADGKRRGARRAASWGRAVMRGAVGAAVVRTLVVDCKGADRLEWRFVVLPGAAGGLAEAVEVACLAASERAAGGGARGEAPQQ